MMDDEDKTDADTSAAISSACTTPQDCDLIEPMLPMVLILVSIDGRGGGTIGLLRDTNQKGFQRCFLAVACMALHQPDN